MRKAKGKKLSLAKLKIAKLENPSSIKGGHVDSKNPSRCPLFYKPKFTIITCPTNFEWG
ncbi:MULTISPECIES: hypothetical protein [Aquimarina]|uniref:hypothetical protein n=1 Tax=Aquimarina TaxID=290174 RepID=UPI000A3E6088|nr:MULTISPECIES: hypothetical protein [Aquimarina]